MGQTGICGHRLCKSHMNVNKEMMVLCALCALCMFVLGLDTGPLLLLPSKAMGPHPPHVCALSADLQVSAGMTFLLLLVLAAGTASKCLND